ncbi:MAG: branched-chain amino acid transport system ATP-binding protein [Solirubrobacteraceae bacterium]|nr:branched-chain amino acid transport system ATP-binding protein [Solirubrobacteraceae bacterium]
MVRPLLELTDLRLHFGGVRALDGVSLAVPEGEVFGLIGPNGAGKTTLINMVTGLAPGGSGSVRVAGVEVMGRPAHAVAGAGVARTFQGVRLYHGLSAVENVVCGMHRRRPPDTLRELVAPLGRVRGQRAARRAAAERLLDLVGLSCAERSGVPASALAYGRQRRVEIARALALDPKLLILDEPVAGMVPTEKREIGSLLGDLCAGGLTVLLIEHDMPLVMTVCSRVAVLDFGRKIADGKPGAVARDAAVLEAYLGSEPTSAPPPPVRSPRRPAAAPRQADLARGVASGRGPALLEIRDLEVRYGAVHAVRGVSIEVAVGEIVAVIGANGAGKSTILAALSGLVRPSAGRAAFDGLDLNRAAPARIVAHGLAHVPEGRQILARLTVRENLELGGFSRGRGGRLAADMAAMEARFPILAERRSTPAGALSGGEQQVLAIARALMARPRLLLLDEPSLGLAPLLAAEVFGMIAELHRGGMTILVVEQNAHRALGLATRGYVIETGRIAFAGPAAELRANPDVRLAYLGADPGLSPADPPTAGS